MHAPARGRRRAGTLLTAAVCGCLAVAAAALAFSELAMMRPRAELSSWQAGHALGDVARRRGLLAQMGRAVAVNPASADHRVLVGRFFAWHGARYPAGSQRHAFFARLAAARFEEAVAARPTWGFAWILLAEQLQRIAAGEAAVVAALRRGGALAPREPRTQLRHLWLALPRYDTLAPAHRRTVTEALTSLLSSPRYFPEAARIVVQHGREELLAATPLALWQRRVLAAVRADAPS